LFLRSAAAGGAFFTTRGLFAEQLVLTPDQTLGPYYPDRLPLDKDNDLLIINDAITPDIGSITWLSGRVLDSRGEPVRGAAVEIWQADNNGAYIHSASPIRNRDMNFQGYGAFVTGCVTGRTDFVSPQTRRSRCGGRRGRPRRQWRAACAPFALALQWTIARVDGDGPVAAMPGGGARSRLDYFTVALSVDWFA
jgi:protocatechuate 3,4-dioxygenase beta subunit